MFRHRHRDEIPSLNTTSTADISFMLLVFFLVTSSMDTDKGLFRQLPPAPQQEEQLLDVKASDVLTVRLDAEDLLTCQGDTVSPQQLTQRVMTFVKSHGAAHVVSVQTHRSTTYNAYFQMQQAIVKAYSRLHCPQRISEEEPIAELPSHQVVGHASERARSALPLGSAKKEATNPKKGGRP